MDWIARILAVLLVLSYVGLWIGAFRNAKKASRKGMTYNNFAGFICRSNPFVDERKTEKHVQNYMLLIGMICGMLYLLLPLIAYLLWRNA
jgi:hypothetical protein